jgi:hypothetical protein
MLQSTARLLNCPRANRRDSSLTAIPATGKVAEGIPAEGIPAAGKVTVLIRVPKGMIIHS